MSVSDYQILQRNEEGYADALMEGSLDELPEEGMGVYVAAFREDDNMMIVRWRRAELDGCRWQAQIRLPEGGLYRLEACLNNRPDWCDWALRIVLVRHVGVGDLYLLTGQSNMAGYGRDTAYDPPVLGVHLYGNNGKWDVASHPMNDSMGTVYPENAEYRSGTSPVLSFARRLKSELGIPVGLVQASLGGSALSQWHPQEDGTLYRAMLKRLEAAGSVKGILWYQGCTDACLKLGDTYLERFCRMVELWREQIGQIPMITVQLNRWADRKEDMNRHWGMVKDAQRQAAKLLKNVYVVPSHDIPMSDGGHNCAGANVILGERMALAALAGIYGKAGAMAPEAETVEYVDETHIRLRFGEAFEVRPKTDRADGMQVEDAAGICDCISAEYEYQSMLLTVERPFTLPAAFHAYWKTDVPSVIAGDVFGMPLLACYGMEIREV